MKVLLADCNVNDRDAAARYQDLMGLDADVRVAVHGELPRRADHDAIVITGSKAGVHDGIDWVRDLALLTCDAIERDIPVLGVCFGHQVIAAAVFGNDAVRIRDRAEIGWFRIERLGDDPLLDGLSEPLRSFVSHRDEVVPRPGLKVLGRTDACPVHILRVEGARAWGVQFHLEMSRAEVEGVLQYRAEKHPELGLEPEKVLAELADTEPDARRVFANFFAQV